MYSSGYPTSSYQYVLIVTCYSKQFNVVLAIQVSQLWDLPNCEKMVQPSKKARVNKVV